MILQALNEYYERKSGSGELAPEGFERKDIPFIVVLDATGALVQIDDTRTKAGKRKQAQSYLVPKGLKKTSGIAANLLWDTAEYVLGVDTRGKPDRVAKQHVAFLERFDEIQESWDDPGMSAVRNYMQSLDLTQLEGESAWKEIVETNPVVTFRISSDPSELLVCQRPAVVAALQSRETDQTNEEFCLAQGNNDALARLHPAIKGVWGAQSSGANIVSFNLAAFNSYGKAQGANAPIGKRAAFTYTTVLNHLLRKGSAQRIQVGDASTVFWATEKSSFEDDLSSLLGGRRDDDPDHGTRVVASLFTAMRSGVYTAPDKDVQFCVLGLAPNAARIAIRFWHVAPVKEFALNIYRHLEDTKIISPGYESDHLSLFRLLNSIALQGKSENVPPNLAGDTMRAILTGLPYPMTLLQAAIRRCRAEQEISYPRAAIVKASINRRIRHQQLDAKELDMSLDKSNTDPGYRLGRLFAALERIQSVAQPGIKATIRDRYYGAASSSPGSVFPILMKLKNHHLSKLDTPALAGWFEKTLGEIFAGITTFPPHLSLAEQGLFAIGYYHQRQDFFTKKNPEDSADPATDPQGEH